MAAALADFSNFACLVWAARDRDKKLEIVKEMIEACRSTVEKKRTFHREVQNMTPARLDRFASDVMLVDNNKVIRGR